MANHSFINFFGVFSSHSQNFHCVSCKSAVDKPDMKIQLEVFLSSSLSNCTLKVKVRTVLLGYKRAFQHWYIDVHCLVNQTPNI